MAATFRTAPMGFNKKDVINYIENLVNDKNAKIESAWDEYKALETRSRKAEIAAERLLRDSEARAEAAEDRLQALQEALDAAHAESARLTDEKQTMEERALGSEQAFADLESAMNELRAAHAAELEALRTAHAEELSAIYAERSTQLDKKTEQIRAYQAAMADKDAEIQSLRSTNLTLLSRVDALSDLVDAYEEGLGRTAGEDEYPAYAAPLLAFKTRFIEITDELSELAQAILEAEEDEYDDDDIEEDDDSLTFPVDLSDDDLPEGDDAEEEDEPAPFFVEELPEEEEIEDNDDPVTRIELTDYPDPARAPKPVQKKGPSVRGLFDRLRTIGDRLL